jgi:hypothetical protein
MLKPHPACLSPESYAMNKLNLAGLLTYSLLIAFPSPPKRNSGLKNEQLKELTATGIVLEFHLLPF